MARVKKVSNVPKDDEKFFDSDSSMSSEDRLFLSDSSSTSSNAYNSVTSRVYDTDMSEYCDWISWKAKELDQEEKALANKRKFDEKVKELAKELNVELPKDFPSMEKLQKMSEKEIQSPIIMRTRVEKTSDPSPNRDNVVSQIIKQDISSPPKRKTKFTHQQKELPKYGLEQYLIEIDIQENDETKKSSRFFIKDDDKVDYFTKRKRDGDSIIYKSQQESETRIKRQKNENLVPREITILRSENSREMANSSNTLDSPLDEAKEDDEKQEKKKVDLSLMSKDEIWSLFGGPAILEGEALTKISKSSTPNLTLESSGGDTDLEDHSKTSLGQGVDLSLPLGPSIAEDEIYWARSAFEKMKISENLEEKLPETPKALSVSSGTGTPVADNTTTGGDTRDPDLEDLEKPELDQVVVKEVSSSSSDEESVRFENSTIKYTGNPVESIQASEKMYGANSSKETSLLAEPLVPTSIPCTTDSSNTSPSDFSCVSQQLSGTNSVYTYCDKLIEKQNKIIKNLFNDLNSKISESRSYQSHSSPNKKEEYSHVLPMIGEGESEMATTLEVRNLHDQHNFFENPKPSISSLVRSQAIETANDLLTPSTGSKSAYYKEIDSVIYSCRFSV